jgi:hypothetical protein
VSCGPAPGQVLVIFTGAIFLFILLCAVVLDVSWYWLNGLRIQRAADAAALAGVVYLPGDLPGAIGAAKAEAAKNGYLDGVGGVTVDAQQDPSNPRRMKVTLSAPVGTFFLRVLGIASLPESRRAKAEYVLPVPMGSPENYYGVFGPLRKPNGGADLWRSPNCTPPDAQPRDPYCNLLTPRGLWGTMISQGSENINGDAYLAKYQIRTSSLNPNYRPSQYYDYAVEMPPGTSNGEVWIFDPVFCATNGSGQYGAGDRWFSGTAATSAFYFLYDTNNTLYDTSDDTLVASSGSLFRRVQASDTNLGGPSGVASCAPGATNNPADPRYWHDRWWKLAGGLSGGAAGRIYRIRTSSTDANSPNDQDGANGHNSFAIWTRATGGSPRVYGLGAMEAFTPLNGGQATTFYFAQIDAVHAGKTMIINLWDPGDTGNLSASLQILQPTATGYTAANLSWSAAWGTTNSNRSSCNGRTGSGTSIVTNTGGSSQFNGCWVTIQIPIPATYTAPQPPGEPGPGWWKIRYTMGGSSSQNAFDLTTWQVEIRGNPVHLVVP